MQCIIGESIGQHSTQQYSQLSMSTQQKYHDKIQLNALDLRSVSVLITKTKRELATTKAPLHMYLKLKEELTGYIQQKIFFTFDSARVIFSFTRIYAIRGSLYCFYPYLVLMHLYFRTIIYSGRKRECQILEQYSMT